MSKSWYSPTINLLLCTTSGIVLFLGLVVLFNQTTAVITVLMTMSAALIFRLDSSNPKH